MGKKGTTSKTTRNSNRNLAVDVRNANTTDDDDSWGDNSSSLAAQVAQLKATMAKMNVQESRKSTGDPGRDEVPVSPFQKENTELWRADLDAWVQINRIQDQQKIFLKAWSTLPQDLQKQLVNLRKTVLNDPPTDALETLQREINRRLNISEESRIDDIIWSTTLGDDLPSDLYEKLELECKSGNACDSKLLGRIFRHSLPPHLTEKLYDCEDSGMSIEDSLKILDRLVLRSRNPTGPRPLGHASVFAVGQTTNQPDPFLPDQFTALMRVLSRIENKLNNLSSDRPNHFNNNQQNNVRQQNSRPYNNNFEPESNRGGRGGGWSQTQGRARYQSRYNRQVNAVEAQSCQCQHGPGGSSEVAHASNTTNTTASPSHSGNL